MSKQGIHTKKRLTQLQKEASMIDEMLNSGGEMGALMRTVDWQATPLGPIANWPQSLRTAVSICLASRFPMLIWWGPHFVKIYNDAYRPMLGATKHPVAMGQSGQECWPEIWDIIGPMLDSVLYEGKATWSDNQLLVLDRNGYLEECYFTFSYSPIRDESGGIGGVFTAVTETTHEVLHERRLRTLRELAARTSEVKIAEEVCRLAAETLAANPADLPFALIYLLDNRDSQDSRRAVLAGTANIEPGSPASPLFIDDAPTSEPVWPLSDTARTGQIHIVDDLGERFGALSSGLWPVPPSQAVILPITRPDLKQPYGFLVAAISPRRTLDDDYRGFLELLSGHIAAAIASARAYEEERKRAEALMELDRAKTAFFSNVSHEFRTPLTLMLAPLEEALDSESHALSLDQLQMVQRNALRLLKLVNTLLDFSRLEAGRAQATYEPTDLAALTAELASVFRSAVENAGLKLVVDCSPLSEPVYIDREMWEKIVLNLLSNALKFTFDGAITVRLDELGDTIRLQIMDTGTGIPADELPRIFERFHRIHNARSRTFEGTGIGLTLVRDLVGLHGGTIDVRSVMEQGSTFIITIPKGFAHLPADQVQAKPEKISTPAQAAAHVAEALRWSASAPAQRDSYPVTQGAYILIADDNADMRDYLHRLLSQRWSVEAVGDGAAALDAARARVPDLVLSDVMMPGLDGFGLLRELRADPLTKEVPIILLSARAGEEAHVEGLDAGADDYLIKPFSAREVIARVNSHLKLAKARQEPIRARDQFLSLAAHELRTPLTSLWGSTQLLMRRIARNETLSQKDQHILEMIAAQSSRLNKMIGALLDISRLQIGQLSLEIVLLDLNVLVRRVVAENAPTFKRHTIGLSAPTAQLTVSGDEMRLEQVLQNLISNAAKYSPEGGLIQVTVDRKHNGLVAVSVTDSGIGIPDEALPHIFNRFYRASNAERDNISGMGIGLYVVKEIVILHGGKITVTSQVGQGSTFTILLPLAQQNTD